MIQSSPSFCIQNNEEKEIFIDCNAKNTNTLFLINICKKGHMLCCAPCCTYCENICCACQFIEKYCCEFFKIDITNMSTNKTLSTKLFSNYENKILSLKSGKYLVSIFQNKKSILRFAIVIDSVCHILKMTIEL